MDLPDMVVLPEDEQRLHDKNVASNGSLSDTVENIIPYKKVVSQTNTKKVYYDDSDFSDSDESLIICHNSRKCKCSNCAERTTTYWRQQLERELRPFFISLPTCILFDAGFRVETTKEMCWCPCGKYQRVWRDAFDLKLEIIDDNYTIKCDGKKITKQGLLDHCRAHSERCSLHFGILRYLELLYPSHS